jgi:3-hydroxyanthranilate 3,4-dioxygenase
MFPKQGFNFQEWIKENGELLKPPVGSHKIYKEGQSTVILVGGPNMRNDYHYNESEEFFHQIKGDITVNLMWDGKPTPMVIKEGEYYLLPAKVPHSPNRPAGTVGLVIEMPRLPDQDDGLLWFCSKCNTKLYEEYFKVTDPGKDFPPVFDRFNAKVENRTCKECGEISPLPGE